MSGAEPGASAQARPELAAKAKALAFYLPQYHPIPENDEWWGKGFTEWANVTKARPLYPGHYQPHVPGELGYYDLRVREVREAQAELARSHGLGGFIYYHYWFNGRRLLERPFTEVLESGSPDFPFALCWANEEWTRNWDGKSGRLLIPQEYSHEDDLAHIRHLAEAFADDRYITIDGKPLLLVYRPMLLPDARRTTEIWRTEAQRLGFPDLYLAWVESWGRPPEGPETYGFDATVGFIPRATERLFTPLESVRGHQVVDYVSAYQAVLRETPPPWKRFPSVMVGWDNTARRPRGATIYEGATPEAYGEWLAQVVDSIAGVREEERFLFVLAWNEWAEGNHLEPDQRYGRAFLEATRTVLLGPDHDHRPPVVSSDPHPAGEATHAATPGHSVDPRVVANASMLLGDLAVDPHRAVVDLGPGIDELGRTLLDRYRPVASTDPADWIDDAGSPHDLGDIGAFVLLDQIGRLPDPHLLASTLSLWSLKNDEPFLVVSVPNVAHFDVGLSLLSGDWHLEGNGVLDDSQLRFFTGDRLERFFARCGWKVAARNDVEDIHSQRFDPDLQDSIPEEMVGALRVLSQTYNPEWAVEEFVWVLTPVEVEVHPGSFAEATREEPTSEDRDLPAVQQHPVYEYLASVGIVASETNRRAVEIRRKPRPRWRREFKRLVESNPVTAAAYRQLRRWLG
jgi:hypothetical protein